MAYLETSGGNEGALRSAQMGSNSNNSVLKSVNLFNGNIQLPITLASISGKDGLSFQVQASYIPMDSQEYTKCNQDSTSSILGYNWGMPLAAIVTRNRTVRQGYQSDFYLIGEGGQYPLYRNGKEGSAIKFFSIEHPTWLFYYYEEPLSKWEIIKEDGSIYTYGGSEDSIEVGLSWDNWVGPLCANGAEQFPVGWYLSSVKSYSGSELSYTYENVKSKLADSFYTRSMRLVEVVSTYGETVKLNYLPKEKNEYVLPHQDVNGENAYQFSYEDNYLDNIELHNNSGQLLYKQKLYYELRSTYENEKKRFLCKVVQETSDGEELEPIQLTYIDTGLQAGFLDSISYPRRGLVCYGYNDTEFSNAVASNEVALSSEGWKYKLIHGSDFIVMMLTRDSEVQVKIYSWDMGWQEFEDKGLKGNSYTDASIYVGNGYVALLYSQPSYCYTLRLIKRSPVRRFDWEIQEYILDGETEAPSLANGSDFIAVQYRKQDILKVFQYVYTDNTWTENTISAESMDYQFIGAGKGCVFAAYGRENSNQIRLRSYYSDENHAWQEGDLLDLSIEVNWEIMKSGKVWSIGATQASATFVDCNSVANAVLVLMQWSDRFEFRNYQTFTVEQEKDIKNPLLYAVTSDTIIGYAQNVFRYTPQGWIQYRLLLPKKGGEYRYAYGKDMAMAVENIDGVQSFVSIRFDPYRMDWVTDGAPRTDSIVNHNGICSPLIAGEYSVLGREVFTRKNDDTWESIGVFPEQVDYNHIQIDSEGKYLLYELYGQNTVCQVGLVNHKLGKITSFDGQRFNDDYAGGYQTGSNAFYTCAREGEAPSVSLHQLFSNEYSHTYTTPVLTSVSYDVGTEKQMFYMDYDLEQARIEGTSAVFGHVWMLPVSREGSYGKTEYVYFNGADPNRGGEYPDDDTYSNARSFYSHMMGREYYSKIYDDKGDVVSAHFQWMRAMDTSGFCICQTKLEEQDFLASYSEDNTVSDDKKHIVSKIIENEYETTYYQKKKSIKFGSYADGSPMKISQNYEYAWEKYPQLKEAHVINAISCVKKIEECSGKVLEAQRSTYEANDTGHWLISEKLKWDGKGKLEDDTSWFSEGKVVKYDLYDQTIVESDSNGVVSTRLYDKAKQIIVAEFVDGTPDEVLYCGFEPYEDCSSITGGEVTNAEHFSGTNSLKLTANSSAKINVRQASGKMRLHFAAKTKDGFTVGYKENESEKEFILPSSNGIWKIYDICVPIEAQADDEATVSVNASNDMYVDAVFFTPLLCKAESYVYSSDFMLQTANHKNFSAGTRTWYDRYKSPALTAGDDGKLLALTRSCYRYADGNGELDEILSVEVIDEGYFCDTSIDANSCDAWSVKNNVWHLKECENRALYIGRAHSAEVRPEIAIGKLQLISDNDQWKLLFDEKVVETADSCANDDYLFIQVGERIQFSCGDNILFTSNIKGLSDEEMIVSSNSKVNFSCIGYAMNPKISITYSDYSGRPVQDVLVTEKGVVVSQSIYTPLGQAAIHTKNVEIEGSHWLFNRNLVKSFSFDTGILEGDINEYFPEDEGFAYIQSDGTKCSDSQIRELGQYGKKFAIHGEGKTVHIDEYTNSDAIRGVKECQGYINVVHDPDGRKTVVTTDVLGNQIEVAVVNEQTGEKRRTSYEHDENGNVTKIYYPNYFDKGDKNDEFVAVLKYDALGNLEYRKEPGTQAVRFIYNHQGQLRFSQTDESQDWYLYYVYDKYGRETEIGICHAKWDEEKLRQEAELTGYIPKGATTVKKMLYDGNCIDTTQLGQMTGCITYQEVTGKVIEEEFYYDEEGRVYKHVMKNGQYSSATFYTYNFQGKVLSQHTDRQEDGVLFYKYDLQGRLKQIRWNEEAIYEAEYNNAGSLCRETYAPSTSRNVIRDYTYNSAQWLTGIKDKFFEQELFYFDKLNTNTAACYSGQIMGITSRFKVAVPDGVCEKSEFEFTYDGLGRVNSAIDVAKNEIENFTYDLNGNRLDGSTYEPGTNLLTIMDDYEYQYDGNGQTVKADNHEISEIIYDKFFQTVAAIKKNNDCYRYEQGSNGYVSFIKNDSITYCMRDKDGRLLSETKDTGERTLCIYGANGLFAQIRNGKIYYLIKDYQASVRAIYDGNDLCAVYNYRPTGGFYGEIWETEETKALIPLRFTSNRLEEHGLYRMKYRFYDPFSGRFIGIDPEGQYASPYLYGGADWINYFDPDGAYSIGSFISGLVGGLLIVAGIAISVATAGIASPAGAFFATAGAAFLIGAGISAVIYSVTSTVNDDFSWTDCLIQMAAGGVFAMIGAGVGAALPAGFTIGALSSSVSSTIVDIGVGVVVGGADGLVTNGCLNVAHGGDFFNNATTNVIIGCTLGGFLSAISGLGSALRNTRTMHEGGLLGGNYKIGIGLRRNNWGYDHSTLWKRSKGALPDYGTDLTCSRGGHAVVHEYYPSANTLDASSFNWATNNRNDFAEFNVPQSFYNRVQAPNAGPIGQFNIITNNCTIYTSGRLAAGGLYAPLWARTPKILYYWGRLLGSLQ